MIIAVAPGVGSHGSCSIHAEYQERDVETPKTVASAPVLQLQRRGSSSQPTKLLPRTNRRIHFDERVLYLFNANFKELFGASDMPHEKYEATLGCFKLRCRTTKQNKLCGSCLAREKYLFFFFRYIFMYFVYMRAPCTFYWLPPRRSVGP